VQRSEILSAFWLSPLGDVAALVLVESGYMRGASGHVAKFVSSELPVFTGFFVAATLAAYLPLAVPRFRPLLNSFPKTATYLAGFMLAGWFLLLLIATRAVAPAALVAAGLAVSQTAAFVVIYGGARLLGRGRLVAR
jgi:hypothetical protein